MNYRHAFHAGNFADVVKHAILTRVVRSLHAIAMRWIPTQEVEVL
jgi:23S rRNA A2030 N6-methylase RlmJ